MNSSVFMYNLLLNLGCKTKFNTWRTIYYNDTPIGLYNSTTRRMYINIHIIPENITINEAINIVKETLAINNIPEYILVKTEIDCI